MATLILSDFKKKPEAEHATNGNFYKITGEGKVKRVNSLSQINEVVDSGKQEANRFITTLYAFLKDRDDSTVRKKDRIICRDYLLGFGNAGFQINDRKNYGKLCSDFDIAFPTPKEVWEFISTPKVIKRKSAAEEALDKDLEKTLKKIRKNIKPESKDVQKLQEHFNPHPKEEVDLEELRKKALSMASRSSNPKRLAERLAGFIPNRSFNVFLNKLIRQFEKGKMRGNKFRTEVIELIKTASFDDKPKPAPKWTGLPFYKLNEVVIEGNDVHITSDGIGKMKVSKSEFLTRYILHTYPKTMVAIFKFLKKQITFEQVIKETYLRDRFIGFSNEPLKGWNEELYNLCLELLSKFEDANPLTVVYRNDIPKDSIKIGDKIKVYWPDYFKFIQGTVLSISTGIEIRYTDGEIFHLYKHQQWQKVASK